jgi:hypothetical protein
MWINHSPKNHKDCELGKKNRELRNQFLNSQSERMPERIPKNAGQLYCKVKLLNKNLYKIYFLY